ncbi:MAG: class I SAM-dependent methyltransferase [Solirubrobacteraceae bacterium]|nr:class I SAM-dependent methyltransferase [Solirubrobacteraceae bacterium]
MTGYDELLGGGYASQRRPDPRIAAQIRQALGDARSVVNVGAGAGSYEPADLAVVAVEPSEVMRAQRPPGAAPCVAAGAEDLPFADGQFDAAMAVLTVHHWGDWRAGCAELRRVAGRCVVLTWDPAVAQSFWLVAEYVPGLLDSDRRRFPATLADQMQALGATHAEPVLVPDDCTDGFLGAHWRAPERYLDPSVRRGMSVFAKTSADHVAAGLGRLEQDVRSGAWADRHRDLLELTELDLGYRLLVSEVADRDAPGADIAPGAS